MSDQLQLEVCLVCGKPMIAMTVFGTLDGERIKVHMTCSSALEKISRVRAGTVFTVENDPDDTEFSVVTLRLPKQAQESVNVRGPDAVDAMTLFCGTLLQGMGYIVGSPRVPVPADLKPPPEEKPN